MGCATGGDISRCVESRLLFSSEKCWLSAAESTSELQLLVGVRASFTGWRRLVFASAYVTCVHFHPWAGTKQVEISQPSFDFRCRLKLSALKSDGIAFDLLLLVSGWVVTLVPIATLFSTLTARLRQPSGLRYQLMHRLHCRWQHIRIRPSSVGVAG